MIILFERKTTVSSHRNLTDYNDEKVYEELVLGYIHINNCNVSI